MRINEVKLIPADLFKEIRESNNLSIADLSKLINIQENILIKLETDEIKPSIRMMKLWQNTFPNFDLSEYIGDIGTKVMPQRKKKLIRTPEMRAEKEIRRAYRKGLREVRKTIKQLKQSMQQCHDNLRIYPEDDEPIAFVTNNTLVYGKFKLLSLDKDALNWYDALNKKPIKHKTVTHWEYLEDTTDEILEYLKLNSPKF